MNNELLVNITEQLILLSAFLGGFSATFLAAILLFNPQHKVANWAVILSAISACSFIVCATSSVALLNGLQADPVELEKSFVSLRGARIVSGLSMAIGIFSLLASIGLSGWFRNKTCGIATSVAALIAITLVGPML